MSANQYKGKPRDIACERIEHYMMENNLPPHHRLPAEREMCGMWGISRTTLRSAISRLTAEGKLYQKKGSGTYVAVPKLKKDLRELRSFTESVKKEGRVPDTKMISAARITADDKVAGKLKIEKGCLVWQMIRLRLIDGIPVKLETVFIDAEKFSCLDKYNLGKQSLYDVMGKYYKLEPDHGIEKIALTYATERESQMLKIAPASPLFFVSGTTETKDDIVVEYFKYVVRSDMVQYRGVLCSNAEDVRR